DATLASGSIDYKFLNTYDYPIIINTYTKDSNLYIEFWSNKEVNKNITYEPISLITGRSAQTYLYGYDLDGNKVYEKFIDTSIYR
ncbi:MAG: VanW family protein, partial [Bacilli bacterium]|nr:VanW family protein [Bacilli bacterium]